MGYKRFKRFIGCFTQRTIEVLLKQFVRPREKKPKQNKNWQIVLGPCAVKYNTLYYATLLCWFKGSIVKPCWKYQVRLVFIAVQVMWVWCCSRLTNKVLLVDIIIHPKIIINQNEELANIILEMFWAYATKYFLLTTIFGADVLQVFFST